MFAVKEIFYSIQGEGHNTGRPAVFVRFAGCNGWSGREEDRERGSLPCAAWCDTDFVGGDDMDEEELVFKVITYGCNFVVFTGGEPALQLTQSLIDRMWKAGMNVAVETNGTRKLPEGVYWRTVSPKRPLVSSLRITSGNELKLVYPTFPPENFAMLDFRHWYLQPMDGPDREKNTKAAIEYCKAHPQWRISLQTHKFMGIR